VIKFPVLAEKFNFTERYIQVNASRTPAYPQTIWANWLIYTKSGTSWYYFFFKKKVREKWCKSKIIKELKAELKIKCKVFGTLVEFSLHLLFQILLQRFNKKWFSDFSAEPKYNPNNIRVVV